MNYSTGDDNKQKSVERNSISELTKENATKSNAIQIPSISLPKGGGAIKGIDEKFQVNASNGTAGYSIQLPLTAGRNGFTPSLSLSYNSGKGNDVFGIGWDLGLPAIQRRTDKKLPCYEDETDSVFIVWDPPSSYSGMSAIDSIKQSMADGDDFVIKCYYTNNVFNNDLYGLSVFFETGTETDTVTSEHLLIWDHKNVNDNFQVTWNSSNGLSPVSNATLTILSKTETSHAESEEDFFIGDVTTNVTTYSFVGIADSGQNNSFILDPCRGYPVPFYWPDNDYVNSSSFFKNTRLKDMLDGGSMPLTVGTQMPILNGLSGKVFNNCVPMQMSIFDKYQFLINGGTYNGFGTLLPFFYQDDQRTYFVAQEFVNVTENYYFDLDQALLGVSNPTLAVQVESYINSSDPLGGPNYHFHNFYHPYACKFVKLLFNTGVDNLLTRSVQIMGDAALKGGIIRVQFWELLYT